MQGKKKIRRNGIIRLSRLSNRTSIYGKEIFSRKAGIMSTKYSHFCTVIIINEANLKPTINIQISPISKYQLYWCSIFNSHGLVLVLTLDGSIFNIKLKSEQVNPSLLIRQGVPCRSDPASYISVTQQELTVAVSHSALLPQCRQSQSPKTLLRNY